MMKNKAKYWIVPILILFTLGCEKMDDNYQKYISNRIYSPKVKELSATAGYKTALLEWINPIGDIAKTIEITYDDVVIKTEDLVNNYKLTDLDLKGYDISVYTIDQHGNRSVPAHVYIFPSGEEEEE